jgi:hypothetical protein
MNRLTALLLLAMSLACLSRAAETKTNSPAGGKVQALFDGKTLTGWAVTDFAGKGEVKVENGLLVLESGYLTGVHWTNDIPKTNYELSLEARRMSGNDFFCGLTFPIAGTNVSLIVGGWGGGLVGISSIDGMDASENETTKFMSFEKDRWYAVKVRVTPDKLEAWLDDKKIADVRTADRRFSLRSGPIEQSVPLGLATYETKAQVRNFVLKRLD